MATANTTVKRFRSKPPLEPEIFSQLIEKKIQSCESAMLTQCPSPWSLGLATRCGQVRAHNEDYGMAFNYLGYQVLAIADGLGGLVYGQLASFLAVETSSQVIAERLNRRLGPRDLQKITSDALQTAALELAHMGDKLNVSRSGLRTTLILIVADRSHAILTYIGDGAVYHYRNSKDCVNVLDAQKANPNQLNVLSASLGPVPHGQPHSRVLSRTPGDCLIAMSDGIADRITSPGDRSSSPLFVNELIERARVLNGNLQTVAEQTVDSLCDLADDDGYICDDNVTLGILGNGADPNGQSG